jgi:hypothetical protein
MTALGAEPDCLPFSLRVTAYLRKNGHSSRASFHLWSIIAIVEQVPFLKSDKFVLVFQYGIPEVNQKYLDSSIRSAGGWSDLSIEYNSDSVCLTCLFADTACYSILPMPVSEKASRSV